LKSSDAKLESKTVIVGYITVFDVKCRNILCMFLCINNSNDRSATILFLW